MMEKKKGICTVCGRLEELKGIMCESCTDKINKVDHRQVLHAQRKIHSTERHRA